MKALNLNLCRSDEIEARKFFPSLMLSEQLQLYTGQENAVNAVFPKANVRRDGDPLIDMSHLAADMVSLLAPQWPIERNLFPGFWRCKSSDVTDMSLHHTTRTPRCRFHQGLYRKVDSPSVRPRMSDRYSRPAC